MKYNLQENWLHLGLNATATPQPKYNGMPWYQAYAQRIEADGVEGRLVSMHTFSEPWTSWEYHPLGSEVVLCIAGRLTLIQDIDGTEKHIELSTGEYAINPPSVWHTVDVSDSCTALFITAGKDTKHRER